MTFDVMALEPTDSLFENFFVEIVSFKEKSPEFLIGTRLKPLNQINRISDLLKPRTVLRIR
jgi:hypothetical protein